MSIARFVLAFPVASLVFACAPAPQEDICRYNNETFQPGDAFPAPDGCNQCVCTNGGAITCTEVAACAEPDPQPEPDPTPEPTPEPTDAGRPPVDAGSPEVDSGQPPFDAGAPVQDAGAPIDAGVEVDAGPPPDAVICPVPTVGLDGCPCGYLERANLQAADNAVFEAACDARPVCESSCCPQSFRPDPQNSGGCIPNDNLPPTLAFVGPTRFPNPDPRWGFQIQAAAHGAERCRVTGFADDRSYDFLAGPYPRVTFTSSTRRYDRAEINLTFLCENEFGGVVDRYALNSSGERFSVAQTSEGSPFRALVCLEDMFDGPCSVTVCGEDATVDEIPVPNGIALGGTCSGGYVATQTLPNGPGCFSVDAAVMTEDQELLAYCEGPDGFYHAFRAQISDVVSTVP